MILMLFSFWVRHPHQWSLVSIHQPSRSPLARTWKVYGIPQLHDKPSS